MDWADVLHRLWRSVAAIRAREELAECTLPALLTLPGVIGAWGLRHAPDGSVVLYWGAGLPLAGDEARAVADELASETKPDETLTDSPYGAKATEATRAWLTVNGVSEVLTGRFEVAGDAPGTFLVLIGPDADPAQVAACLSQVADAAREAVRLLAVRRVEQEQQVRDALLAEASLQMDAELDTTHTLRRVARMAVPAVAEGCLVYVCDDKIPKLRASVHVDMRRLAAVLADPVIVDRLLGLAAGVIAGRPVPADTQVAGARAIDAQVLRARGRVVGVLIFLYERPADRMPTQGFIRDLAYRAALAIDNGELYERRRLEVAAMQRHLLPRALPEVPGVAMLASYTVGDQVMEVGGDFYDVVPRPDGSVSALIGDVCGRGVDAAALTGMARHTLGALLQEGVSPARAFDRLNTGLRRNGSWRFITAGLALFRAEPGGLAVRWTSCGHPPPIVLRKGRDAETCRGGGVPLGILPTAKVGTSRFFLGYGDTLLMFTDGLTESRDRQGRTFEEAGLAATLRHLRDAPLDVLVDGLTTAATAFGAAGDDIAVLTIRPEEREP